MPKPQAKVGTMLDLLQKNPEATQADLAELEAATQPRRSPVIRASTLPERIRDKYYDLFESAARQPIGRIADALGLSDLQGIANERATGGKLVMAAAADAPLKAGTLAKVAKEAQAARGLVQVTDDLFKSGLKESQNLDPRILYFIQHDANGVIVGQPRTFDKAILRGEFTLGNVSQQFAETRELLRRKHGDSLTLYRAETDPSRHNPNTLTVYMGDKNLASKFGDAKPYTVKTDDVVAMYAKPSGYYEFIVKTPPIRP